ncbi:hypothetical protein VTN77DRAFT_9434 [Rasamsonia byssochlamydoides]|uniref:uncharacterized protein n=1 Tax=Rasamsonia byssochlamydoides TaxID=89139 RepID=UPI003742DBA1
MTDSNSSPVTTCLQMGPKRDIIPGCTAEGKNGESAQRPPPRPPRLNHKKSRTGCQLCRLRRVKCDEVHPVCGHCRRHNVPCDYDRFRPVQIASSQPQPRNPGDDRTVHSQDGPSEARRLTRSSRHLLELRLFHHFTTQTSQTLPTATEPKLAQIWREYVPQLALQHTALLDVIYSLAALHLALSESPTKELIDAHRDYMDSALKGHRQDVCHINSSNMDAVWFTSCLVRSLVFAALQERKIEPYTPPREWLQIASTAAPTFVAVWERAKADPKAEAHRTMTMFKDSAFAIDPQAVFRDANRQRFAHLLERALPRDQCEAWNDDIREAYEHALNYLGAIQLAIDAGESSKQMSLRLIGFASIVPPRFIDLVLDGQPRALVVLAHFFALMAGYTDHWCIGSTPRREILGIQTVLPQEWQPLMRWPVSVCK